MGHLGNPSAPKVQEAVKSAVTRILDAGSVPGILAANHEDAKRYLGWDTNLSPLPSIWDCLLKAQAKA